MKWNLASDYIEWVWLHLILIPIWHMMLFTHSQQRWIILTTVKLINDVRFLMGKDLLEIGIEEDDEEI